MRPFVMIATLVVVSFTTEVFAQTSISASLIGNIARTDSVETLFILGENLSNDGESLGVAVRATQPFNERWGVEVEFVWPGTIENEMNRQIPFPSLPPLRTLSPELIASLTLVNFPPPTDFRVTSQLALMTLGTTAWYKQPAGGRTSLVYSAGASFLRSRQELEQTYSNPAALFLFPAGQRTTVVNYSAGVLLGFDARIEMTEHLELVPGIRFHASRSNLWLIRPGVGLAWKF